MAKRKKQTLSLEQRGFFGLFFFLLGRGGGDTFHFPHFRWQNGKDDGISLAGNHPASLPTKMATNDDKYPNKGTINKNRPPSIVRSLVAFLRLSLSPSLPQRTKGTPQRRRSRKRRRRRGERGEGVLSWR